MKNLLLVLFVCCCAGMLSAQPKPDTSKIICTVELPKTVTSETVFSLRADCKLKSVKIDVFSRWGEAMFKTESMDEHELGNKFKSLKAGQYSYTLTYTYFRGGVLNERKSQGEIYIVK